MDLKFSRLVTLLLLVGNLIFAQNKQEKLLNLDVVDSTQLNKEPLLLNIKPWIGLGAGNLAYFGDISSAKIERTVVTPIAYQITIGHNINNFLMLRLAFLGGKIGLTGMDNKRFYNFRSQIYAGSASVEYNFDHFLPKSRFVEPFITLGLSGFEFLSKADQFDADGNAYYYWSDGSIRNRDENTTDKNKAIIISRDYIFESDLRTQDLDKLGKYPEFSFAIPAGVGITMLADRKFQFKVGTSMYFSATDNIDNISSKGIGIRQGKKNNDNFLFTYFNVSYNLTHDKDLDIIENDAYINNLVEGGDEDSDSDGVVDFLDSSAFTPVGVKVNRKGIPFDNDRDYIPNYRDEEVFSDSGAIVSEIGVKLADSTIARLYDDFMNPEKFYLANLERLKDVNASNLGSGMFKVLLGEYKTGVPYDKINKFLSLREMNNYDLNDSIVAYTTGVFKTYADAKARLETVSNIGLNNAKIVVHKNGKFIPVSDSDYYKYEIELRNTVEVSSTEGVSIAINKENKTELPNTENVIKNQADEKPKTKSSSDNLVYHVQLGAYKGKIKKEIFAGIKDLVEVRDEDGITRVIIGEYENYADAAKRKVEMQYKGFEEVFVTAYKNGNRISLKTAGVKFTEPVIEDTVGVGPKIFNKKSVVFKVQLGVFKNNAPLEMQKAFDKIKDIEQDLTISGLYRFTSGKFTTYDEAKKHKEELISKGIKDVFIIAFFNEQLIDIQEALEYLK